MTSSGRTKKDVKMMLIGTVDGMTNRDHTADLGIFERNKGDRWKKIDTNLSYRVF